ncbi:MAG: hypothetical protein LBH46_00820 [Rickettsiales bacterium]|nr:hypothetical protein [Rickettsiales bacterium]
MNSSLKAADECYKINIKNIKPNIVSTSTRVTGGHNRGYSTDLREVLINEWDWVGSDDNIKVSGLSGSKVIMVENHNCGYYTFSEIDEDKNHELNPGKIQNLLKYCNADPDIPGETLQVRNSCERGETEMGDAQGGGKYCCPNNRLQRYCNATTLDASGVCVGVQGISKEPKNSSGKDDPNFCTVTYFLPKKFTGIDSNRSTGGGVATDTDNYKLSKIGSVDDSVKETCRPCDSLSLMEFRAVNNRSFKSDGKTNVPDVGSCPEGDIDCIINGALGASVSMGSATYKKYCSPTLYCNEMTKPEVFPFLWVKGAGIPKLEFVGENISSNSEVYHCRIHQCPRQATTSSQCPTSFDKFYAPSAEVLHDDVFGGSKKKYIHLYERDILNNYDYAKNNMRDNTCEMLDYKVEGCNKYKLPDSLSFFCNKVSCADETSIRNVVLRNGDGWVCDEYTGVDNGVTNKESKYALVSQAKTILKDYNEFRGNTGSEDYSSSCIRTVDCGLSANASTELCRTSGTKSEPQDIVDDFSFYMRPTPSPRATEIVCQITDSTDGKLHTYGKYYNDYHSNHRGDNISGGGYCDGGRGGNISCDGDGVTKEFINCVDKGGTVKVILKRTLFGQNDIPLHPNWDKEHLVLYVLLGVLMLPIGFGVPTSVWYALTEPGRKTQAKHYEYSQSSVVAIKPISSLNEGDSNKLKQMFCVSSSDYRGKFETRKITDIIAGGKGRTYEENNYYSAEFGISATEITNGGLLPIPLGICDASNTGVVDTSSTYTCGNNGNFCNEPYHDSYYISGNPRFVFDEKQPRVKHVSVTACLRFKPLGELNVCGKRETRVDCAFGTCSFQMNGGDECVTMTVTDDEDCTLENVNSGSITPNNAATCVSRTISNGTFNSFRFRARKIGAKYYVFLDRTSGGCTGKNTTYAVAASSDIDEIRDAENVYGTCAIAEKSDDNSTALGFKRIFCRDNMTDISAMNTCIDGARGACNASWEEGKDGNEGKLKKNTTTLNGTHGSFFNVSEFMGPNPKYGLIGKCSEKDGDGNIINVGTLFKNDSTGFADYGCKVIEFKRRDEYNHIDNPDFSKRSRHSVGPWYKGRLTGISMLDDNSLSDNNCDGKITDEDVYGEHLFKNLNCSAMYESNYKIKSRNGNYVLVESDKWCENYREEGFNKNRYSYRFGGGPERIQLVNEKCYTLKIDKKSNTLKDGEEIWWKPEDKKNDKDKGDWMAVDVVQYIGNNQIDGSSNPLNAKNCAVDNVLGCRGVYSEMNYETGENGVLTGRFIVEQQGASVPIPLPTPVYWRYATATNTPNLFMPIVELHSYRKVNTSNYLLVRGTSDEVLDFFAPSIKLKYHTTVQTDADATTIFFSQTSVSGSISTNYNGSIISTDYRFKKYGQIYPTPRGLACAFQVSLTGNETQIGCLSRGTPPLNKFAMVADESGRLKLEPFVKAFFHNGDTYPSSDAITPTVGKERDDFLTTNAVEDVRERKNLLLRVYGVSSCASLPLKEDESKHLSSVPEPRNTCNSYDALLNGINSYRNLRAMDYGYASGYPIFMTSSYCSQLHYSCVKNVNSLEYYRANPDVEGAETQIIVLEGRIRNCEMQIENFCTTANGGEKTIQFDDDVDSAKLTNIRENWYVNGAFSEMCASSGFEKYFEEGSVHQTKVYAIDLDRVSTERIDGIGKCVLDNTVNGKLNPACRREFYTEYCDRGDDCKPLADILPQNCSVSLKNCVRKIDCSCSGDACLGLDERCFKPGYNLFRTILSNDSGGDVPPTVDNVCACKLAGLGSDGFDQNIMEVRTITPRELGICAPLQTQNFCAPVKYYDANKSYEFDGGSGNALDKIVSLFYSNIWRTYQKIEGRYYIAEDLGHAEFERSNICRDCGGLSGTALTDCQAWNENFCLSTEYTYNRLTGEECPGGSGTSCVRGNFAIGQCVGFWRNKSENITPIANCVGIDQNTGRSCSDFSVSSCVPRLQLVDNTECVRYVCPFVNESDVYHDGFSEEKDYSEYDAMTSDDRGVRHGYALWNEYKKGSDVDRCILDENCEFHDYDDEGRNIYQADLPREQRSDYRSGIENGRGDDIEERVANFCAQGYGPAGSNYILRKYMAHLLPQNTGNVFDTTGEGDLGMIGYIRAQNEYVRKVLGANIGFYGHRNIMRRLPQSYNLDSLHSYNISNADDFKDYMKFSAFARYYGLEHLPVRYCTQTGEWQSPSDLYNLHGVSPYYKANTTFESLANDTDKGIINDLGRIKGEDILNKNKTSMNIDGSAVNINAKYCERLYCPGFDEEYAGFLSLENSCDPANTDPAISNPNCPVIPVNGSGNTVSITRAGVPVTYNVYWNNSGVNRFQYPNGLYNSYAQLNYVDTNSKDVGYVSRTSPYDDPRNATLYESFYNNAYYTPTPPSAFDTRGNTELMNKYTIWRHAAGASWDSVTAPRAPGVDFIKVQGKCINERKFFTSDTVLVKDFEGQYNSAFRVHGANSNIGLTTKKSLKAPNQDKYVMVTNILNEFISTLGSKEPTRYCGKFGQWSAVNNGCVSACEALDPFRTEFFDANYNGYLENWEITSLLARPTFSRGANVRWENKKRNVLQNGIQNWKRYNPSQRYADDVSNIKLISSGGKSVKDFMKYFWEDWTGNKDNSGAIVGMPCVVEDKEGNKIDDPNCGTDVITLQTGYGDYLSKAKFASGVDESTERNGVRTKTPTWERVDAEDVDWYSVVYDNNGNITNIEFKKGKNYHGYLFGDKYTGGAKWPRSLSLKPSHMMERGIVNDSDVNSQYIYISDAAKGIDKVYVKGECVASVGPRYQLEKTNWLEDFPDEGVTFVRSGPTNIHVAGLEGKIAKATGGAPYRECMEDGTWGKIHNPCINFKTCTDFTLNTKNILQLNVDNSAESFNTPRTDFVSGFIDNNAVDKSSGKLTHTAKDERGASFGFRVVKAEDAQQNEKLGEQYAYVGTLNGGAVTIGQAEAGDDVNINTECQTVNTMFLEKTIDGRPVNADRSNVAMIGRTCDTGAGLWKSGYAKYDCKMKACGDVSYVIGGESGGLDSDKIAIVDYKVDRKGGAFIVSGGTINESNVINSVSGIYYPKSSGYQGEVKFGKYNTNSGTDDRQVFTNYEFMAKCPNGYVCKDCPNNMLKFTCDLPSNPNSDSRPFWTRTGECVALSCVWQNDYNARNGAGKSEDVNKKDGRAMIYGEYVNFDVNGKRDIKNYKVNSGVLQGLDWSNRYMVLPEANLEDEDNESIINVAGGIPRFDYASFYYPNHTNYDNQNISDAILLDRKVITPPPALGTTQYNYNSNSSNKNIVLTRYPYLSRTSIMINDNNNGLIDNHHADDVKIGDSNTPINPPRYMANNTVGVDPNVPSYRKTWKVHTDSNGSTSINKDKYFLFPDNKRNEKNEFSKSFPKVSSVVSGECNGSIECPVSQIITKAGRVSVGTKVRMDAFCVRRKGLFYPKNRAIIAECVVPVTGPTEDPNSKWELPGTRNYDPDNGIGKNADWDKRNATAVWDVKVYSDYAKKTLVTGGNNPIELGGNDFGKCIRACDIRDIYEDGTEIRKSMDKNHLVPHLLKWTGGNPNDDSEFKEREKQRDNIKKLMFEIRDKERMFGSKLVARKGIIARDIEDTRSSFCSDVSAYRDAFYDNPYYADYNKDKITLGSLTSRIRNLLSEIGGTDAKITEIGSVIIGLNEEIENDRGGIRRIADAVSSKNENISTIINKVRSDISSIATSIPSSKIKEITITDTGGAPGKISCLTENSQAQFREKIEEYTVLMDSPMCTGKDPNEKSISLGDYSGVPGKTLCFASGAKANFQARLENYENIISTTRCCGNGSCGNGMSIAQLESRLRDILNEVRSIANDNSLNAIKDVVERLSFASDDSGAFKIVDPPIGDIATDGKLMMLVDGQSGIAARKINGIYTVMSEEDGGGVNCTGDFVCQVVDRENGRTCVPLTGENGETSEICSERDDGYGLTISDTNHNYNVNKVLKVIRVKNVDVNNDVTVPDSTNVILPFISQNTTLKSVTRVGNSLFINRNDNYVDVKDSISNLLSELNTYSNNISFNNVYYNPKTSGSGGSITGYDVNLGNDLSAYAGVFDDFKAGINEVLSGLYSIKSLSREIGEGIENIKNLEFKKLALLILMANHRYKQAIIAINSGLLFEEVSVLSEYESQIQGRIGEFDGLKEASRNGLIGKMSALKTSALRQCNTGCDKEYTGKTDTDCYNMVITNYGTCNEDNNDFGSCSGLCPAGTYNPTNINYCSSLEDDPKAVREAALYQAKLDEYLIRNTRVYTKNKDGKEVVGVEGVDYFNECNDESACEVEDSKVSFDDIKEENNFTNKMNRFVVGNGQYVKFSCDEENYYKGDDVKYVCDTSTGVGVWQLSGSSNCKKYVDAIAYSNYKVRASWDSKTENSGYNFSLDNEVSSVIVLRRKEYNGDDKEVSVGTGDVRSSWVNGNGVDGWGRGSLAKLAVGLSCTFTSNLIEESNGSTWNRLGLSCTKGGAYYDAWKGAAGQCNEKYIGNIGGSEIPVDRFLNGARDGWPGAEDKCGSDDRKLGGPRGNSSTYSIQSNVNEIYHCNVDRIPYESNHQKLVIRSGETSKQLSVSSLSMSVKLNGKDTEYYKKGSKIFVPCTSDVTLNKEYTDSVPVEILKKLRGGVYFECGEDGKWDLVNNYCGEKSGFETCIRNDDLNDPLKKKDAFNKIVQIDVKSNPGNGDYRRGPGTHFRGYMHLSKDLYSDFGRSIPQGVTGLGNVCDTGGAGSSFYVKNIGGNYDTLISAIGGCGGSGGKGPSGSRCCEKQRDGEYWWYGVGGGSNIFRSDIMLNGGHMGDTNIDNSLEVSVCY